MVAGAVCVVAVMLLAWIIGGLVGSADDQPVRGTAGSRDLPATPSSPAPSARPTGTSSTSQTAPTAPTSPAAPSPAPSSPARPTSRPAPKPAGPPKPCPDAVIKVLARPGAAVYRVGQHPLLRLLVVNAGPVPCIRDVSRALRELVITTVRGGRRVWSSIDCYHPPGVDRRVLVPHRPLTFSLNWAGRTSAPGCPADRTAVPAGRYRVTGRLGRLAGPPAPLTLTR